jgi:hypothetical protein
MSLNEEQQERYNRLQQSMFHTGLTIRDDSDLCWDYVLHGSKAKVLKDPEFISKRMAEAQYLHIYCNFQLGYNIAQNIARKRKKQNLQPLPHQEWLELINTCVLSTTVLNTYPEVWPWLQNISIQDWKHQNTKNMF